ncbi:MAG: alpha-mannosidase [Candidatus Cloacimonetes bacterium]|nr:alpha-mannosidase [Candidatus Cloacimonadota bacterium]
MLNEKIYVTRIQRFRDELAGNIYTQRSALQAEFIYEQEYPLPYQPELDNSALKEIVTSEGKTYRFEPILTGEEWGKTWGSGWFRFSGKIPAEWQDKEVGALIDLEAEGCIFINAQPWQGLTNKIHWNVNSGKRLAILTNQALGGEDIFLLVEAGANGLFGAGQEFYRLKQAELCLIDRQAWQLYYDLETIASLIEKLPERTSRRQKLIHRTNDAISAYNDGKGIDISLEITAELLAMPAVASALDVYSVGHAHLDLGWLWPVRETRRKGGRTFATALRFMEEYPEYKFGASQAQLYEWVKEDYPGLYEQVKTAVAEGKWECQGAMWVEPDMNITSGESLVRQCIYGKKFWLEEFGKDVDHLWLPDVFGYSAALPQILQKCGVKYFMTQKISWNETNIFPHHTFYWEGIDGTRIATHFLPANDYNCSNLPKQMIEAEERFAQNDVANEFLNLFGIGDGGGGPSRIHIELGLRQQNLEGSPKFKFALAEEYFKKLGKISPAKLPVWKGELYLELHRGTYTTQALMKKYNRQLELELRDIEFMGAIAGKFEQQMIDTIWKNTLLNQFHDILPGSSIKMVYDDAHALSEQNLLLLHNYRQKLLADLHPEATENNWHYIVYNTLSWQRTEVLTLELPDDDDGWEAFNIRGEKLFSETSESIMQVQVTVPSLGYTTVRLQKSGARIENKNRLQVTTTHLENELLRVELADDGTLVSVCDKELNREMLAGKANLFLMFEDKPNDWGAWDINHFYRDTEPEQAVLLAVNIVENSALTVALQLEFRIGNSLITQIMSLNTSEKMLSCWQSVDWKEKDKMLRLRAVPEINCQEAAFEIQYGIIKRPTHNNTSWDRARFEVCAHRFADLSQQDCGFALLNDCKYGHYIKDNVMELTLLRSPRYPDNTADIREHFFSFAYLPHAGSLEESDVLQQAHAFNSELITHKTAVLPEIPEHSYIGISGGNVKLEVMKPAVDGEGIILRFYEYYGKECRITFKADKKWRQLLETDLLENELHLISRDSADTHLFFKPFEIRTFRLK